MRCGSLTMYISLSTHCMTYTARWRQGTHSPKGNFVGLLEGLGRVTRTVSMSVNGSIVVTGGDDRMVRVWELGRHCCDDHGSEENQHEGLNSRRAWMGEWGVKSVGYICACISES